MLHVAQIPIEEEPKTGLVFAQLMKNLGLSVDRCRHAVRGCQGSGLCVTGCVYGAKQALFSTFAQVLSRPGKIDTEPRGARDPADGGIAGARMRAWGVPYRFASPPGGAGGRGD